MYSVNPIGSIVLFLGGVYIATLYWKDIKSTSGQDCALRIHQPLPGACLCNKSALIYALLGAILILCLEITGEFIFHLTPLQSDITLIYLFAMIGASITEEVIFRGFLVVKDQGKIMLWGSVFLFSILFSILHPYLWEYNGATFQLTLSFKGYFTTFFLFLNSLWFYTVRFFPQNPNYSLLPCIAAHLSSNLGVFITKWAQGHVVGLH